tara:strand:- start:800 stop:1105 length:306 start_codon:yes stop_codon:yes gene_type:complete
MRYEILEIRLNNNYNLGEEVRLYNLKGEVMAKDENLYHIRIKDFGNKEKILTKTEKRTEVIDLYIDAYKKFPVEKFNDLSKKRNNFIDKNLDKLLLETELD